MQRPRALPTFLFPFGLLLLLSFAGDAAADCLVAAPEDGSLSGCGDVDLLAEGDTCTATCDTGYVVQGAFVCNESGVLTENATCEEAPCSAPTGISEASSISCEEGELIAAGETCTPSCNEGLSPTVSSLTCARGSLTPSTFQCTAPRCSVPTGIANAASTICAEGNGELEDGASCTAQCAENYIPSPSSLACSLGELEPRTFTCAPSGCEAPTGIENAATSTCSEGSELVHGGACTAQCAAGYVASPPSLSCGLGTLSPATFECVPAGCSAPEDISMAATIACAEGSTISDGGSCSAKCQSGYTPSVTALSCSNSVLSPDTFACRPKACSAPTGIENSDDQPCYEGSKIAHGSSCTPTCDSGYAAVPSSLTCALGTLYPATFSCRSETCAAPSNIAHSASEVCAEGTDVIAHGSSCTAQCEPGYAPSHEVLRCSGGSLTPRTFQCEPQSCTAPTGIAQAASVSCHGGTTIAHGDVCAARCAVGYTPFPSALGCGLGILTPSTFQCVSSGCVAPSGIENAAESSCSEGSSVHDGGICTTACAAGYNPSVESLECDLDTLTPATFTCERTGCYAPTVSNAPTLSCEEGVLIPDGYNCTSRCKSGYQASVGLLHCSNGNFTESFSCTLIAQAEAPSEVVMSVPAFLVVFFLNLFVMIFLSVIVGWRCFVWGRKQASEGGSYAAGYNDGSFAGWLKGQQPSKNQSSSTAPTSTDADGVNAGQNERGEQGADEGVEGSCCTRCCRRRKQDAIPGSGTPDMEAGQAISIVVHPPGAAEPPPSSPNPATNSAEPAQAADGDANGPRTGSQYQGMNPFAAGSDTLDSIPDGNSPFYPKDSPGIEEADVPAAVSSTDDGQSPDRRTSVTSVASLSAAAAGNSSSNANADGGDAYAPTTSQPPTVSAAASSSSPERSKKKGGKVGDKDKPRKRRSKEKERTPTADPNVADQPEPTASVGVISGPMPTIGLPIGIDPSKPLDTSAME